MSDRYTISVYIDRQIADIKFYTNWDDKSLFYESIAIAALHKDCRTVEEYRVRRYGNDKDKYDFSEEFLKELESCSEGQIVVDISEQCIYGSRRGVLDKEQISKLPIIYDDDIGRDHKFSKISIFQNYRALLDGWKLPFGDISSSEVISLILGGGVADLYVTDRTTEQMINFTSN